MRHDAPMTGPGLLAQQRDSAEAALRHSDLRRAARTTVAFMGPLLLAHLGVISGPVMFAAISAQNVALMDIRGAYGVRANLLLAKTAILVGATWLGFAVAGHALAAVLATALIALFMGLWRHLSSDYGPS